jgi:branched-chain amino acid transport system permease protein
MRALLPPALIEATADGILSLADFVWFGTVAWTGYTSARRRAGASGISEQRPVAQAADVDHGRDARESRGAAVAVGALAGLCSAAPLVALVLLGTRLPLRQMFVHATPALYRLLTFQEPLEELTGRDDPVAWGVAALVAVSALLGAAGAVLARMPRRPRAALLIATTVLVALGTLQNLVEIAAQPYGRRADVMLDLVYARNGLSIEGAIAIGALVFLWLVAWPRLRNRAGPVTAPLARHPAWRRSSRTVGILLLAVALLGLPFAAGTYLTEVLDTVGLYVLMGLGLNIVVGYAGLLDLGYVAFYAIGAYTVGVLTSGRGEIAVDFWVALPIALGISVLAGVALGIPVLKTHGDYLAIITLGFGEIIRLLAISDWLKPWLGGAQGLQHIDKAVEWTTFPPPFLAGVLPFGPWRLPPPYQIYYPILGATLVALYVAWRLRYSRFGRAWTAIREDEEVAAAMGIDLVQAKLFAFATGATFAGVSGALFATKLQSVFPHSFQLIISINVLVLIIVGGMGSLPGVLIGALVLVGAPELLREVGDYRMLIYGAVLVIMMLNRPEGLWPSRLARRELSPGEGAAVAAETPT